MSDTFYKSRYYKYKNKYLNLKKLQSGSGTTSSSSSPNFEFYDQELVQNEIIDHNFIEKNFEFNYVPFQLFSVNIPQQNNFRTMTIFNEVKNMIRSEKNLNSHDPQKAEAFLSNLKEITKDYIDEIETFLKNLVKTDSKKVFNKIKDEDKQGFYNKLEEIVGSESIEDFKAALNSDPTTSFNLEIENSKVLKLFYNFLGLDKKAEERFLPDEELKEKIKDITKEFLGYVPEGFKVQPRIGIKRFNGDIIMSEYNIANSKEKDKEKDRIFKENYPNDYYLDVYFDEETLDHYKARIRKTLEKILELSNPQSNLIICLQEINPLQPLVLHKDEVESKNIFEQLNLNLVDLPEKLEKISKSSSIVLTSKNFQFEIDELKDNQIIELIKGDKGPTQNIGYILTVGDKKLEIFNVHTNLFRNDEAFRNLEEIVNYASDKNLILVGDMNLDLDNIFRYKLEKLFRDRRMHLYLINTPEIEYGTSESTYDIFIGKGIKLLF